MIKYEYIHMMTRRDIYKWHAFLLLIVVFIGLHTTINLYIKLVQARRESQKYRAIIVELQSIILKNKNRNNALHEQLQESFVNNAKQQYELDMLRNNESTLKQELEALQQDDIKDEQQKIILQYQIDALQDQLSSKHQLLSQHASELSEIQQKYRQIQYQLNSINQKIENVQNTNQELTEDIAQYSDTHHKLCQEKEQLEEILHEYQEFLLMVRTKISPSNHALFDIIQEVFGNEDWHTEKYHDQIKDNVQEVVSICIRNKDNEIQVKHHNLQEKKIYIRSVSASSLETLVGNDLSLSARDILNKIYAISQYIMLKHNLNKESFFNINLNILKGDDYQLYYIGNFEIHDDAQKTIKYTTIPLIVDYFDKKQVFDYLVSRGTISTFQESIIDILAISVRSINNISDRYPEIHHYVKKIHQMRDVL